MPSRLAQSKVRNSFTRRATAASVLVGAVVPALSRRSPRVSGTFPCLASGAVSILAPAILADGGLAAFSLPPPERLLRLAKGANGPGEVPALCPGDRTAGDVSRATGIAAMPTLPGVDGRECCETST